MIDAVRGSILGAAALLVFATSAIANPAVWRYEWPTTDFERTSVDFGDIISGGPP
jgi:hypothetical protein